MFGSKINTLPEKTFNRVLLFFLFFSLIAAAYAVHLFHAPAKEARNVEITVRYSDVEIFASRAGLSVPEALHYLREQGVTSIGVPEYYLWKLRRDPGHYVLSNLELVGELSLNPELSPYREFLTEAATAAGLSFGDYIVFMPAGPWAEQVGEHLAELYYVEQRELFKLQTRTHEGMVLYIIQGAHYENLPYLSLGAKPQELEQVAAAGLLVNPYLAQRAIERAGTAEQMLAAYEQYPLSAAVFEGGKLPRYIEATAAAMQERGIPAVIYEYSQFPQGMEKLASLLGYNLVVMRPGKVDDPPAAALNGIRERRVQLLELQIRNFLPRYGGEELVEHLTAQLSLLMEALQKNGYTPGKASPLLPARVHPVLYAAMAAGLIALFLLVLQLFFSWKTTHRLVLFVLGMLFVSAMFCWNFLLTQQALALAAAVLFPVSAALLFFFLPHAEKGDAVSFTPGVQALCSGVNLEAGLLLRTYTRILLVFLLAAGGGLLLHGFLTTPPFFHGMALFRGVKVMYILPLAFIALMALIIKGSSENDARTENSASSAALFSLQLSRERREAFHAFSRNLLKRPVTIGDAVLLGVALAAAFVYITRTGHVLEITPLEGTLRSFLEGALGVRPRFKEYLLGYPLAVLGLYLLGSSGKRALRRLAFIFLVGGTLAPVSVVNTFAHVTAPAYLSFIRSLHGFWLGCLGGLLFLLAWHSVALLLLLRRAKSVKKEQRKS